MHKSTLKKKKRLVNLRQTYQEAIAQQFKALSIAIKTVQYNCNFNRMRDHFKTV